MNKKEDLYTINELSKLFGVSKQTITSHLNKLKISSEKIGNDKRQTKLYRYDVVDELENDGLELLNNLTGKTQSMTKEETLSSSLNILVQQNENLRLANSSLIEQNRELKENISLVLESQKNIEEKMNYFIDIQNKINDNQRGSSSKQSFWKKLFK